MAHDSVLRIYSGVPFDPRYEHTVLFASETAQQSYFNSTSGGTNRAKREYQFTDFSFQRKDMTVVVAVDMETLEEKAVNYCATYNGEKWRYYFVHRVEYVSPSSSRLYVELDVLQTYQFDWSIPRCFVEREHVSNDAVGANLVDEGLETGEIIAHSSQINTQLRDLVIMVQSSMTMGYTEGQYAFEKSMGYFLDKMYSGLLVYCVDSTTSGATTLKNALNKLDELAKSDAILSMWVYPKSLVDTEGSGLKLVKGSKYITWEQARPSSLGGYTPRNKKLLSYPYSFLHMYNNHGQGAMYKYELFGTGSIYFNIIGSIANDGVVRLIPQNYRGIAIDNESGLSITGYPTCAWAQDMYKIWMAQNANTQAFTLETAKIGATIGFAQAGLGVIQSVAGMIGGSGGGGGASNITSGLSSVYNAYKETEGLMAQRADKQVEPPQSKGAQSGSCNISYDLQTFTASHMGITEEFARRLDSYFDMYGYRVNTVKVPNLNNRAVWNYVKTVGCVITGGIDARDRVKIASIFDKGVTLWHAPESMYRYDLAASNTQS